MTETLVQWFVQNLGGSAAKELIIFIISMIPILELRGGLLAAGPAFLNVPMWRAIPICIIGNLIPVPFILLLLRRFLPG
ncbi:MAG: small multi-drug export protein [Eubacteriales bacterium]